MKLIKERSQTKHKAFTCGGCGERKTPDGAPRNAAFVWTHVKTKKRTPYCYECDDKLIQGVELPKEKSRNVPRLQPTDNCECRHALMFHGERGCLSPRCVCKQFAKEGMYGRS